MVDDADEAPDAAGGALPDVVAVEFPSGEELVLADADVPSVLLLRG